MIRFLDPRAEPGAPIEPYRLGIDLEAGGSTTVGLLANGFPDSKAFLARIGAALEARLPGLRIRHYDKGNASIVAPEPLIRGISEECKAVVTAYGH